MIRSSKEPAVVFSLVPIAFAFVLSLYASSSFWFMEMMNRWRCLSSPFSTTEKVAPSRPLPPHWWRRKKHTVNNQLMLDWRLFWVCSGNIFLFLFRNRALCFERRTRLKFLGKSADWRMSVSRCPSWNLSFLNWERERERERRETGIEPSR